MRITHTLASLMLTIPLVALAAAGSEPPCPGKDLGAAAQKYWARQSSSFAAHGMSAHKAGDQKDAEHSLKVAEYAARMSCTKDLQAVAALDLSVARSKLDAAMLQSAKLIAGHQYVNAYDTLTRLASFAGSKKLPVPEGQPVLMKTANIGRVEEFFAEIDKDVANNRLSREDAEQEERDACLKGIPPLNIGTPERCKKYAK